MNYIDGHCHLADPRFSENLSEVIQRSREKNVVGWVQGGVDPSDWDRQDALHKKYGTTVIRAYGLHPWWVAEQTLESVEQGLIELEKRLPAAKALGELGLDFSPRHEKSLTLQKEAFRKQIELGKRANKPLILHIVKAHEEAIAELKNQAPYPASGLVHSFSAAWEVGEAYLELGFLLSISGVVTRGGFKNLKKALKSLPLEKLVLETDSPDQAPTPNEGGSWNEPANLIRVAEGVSQFRDESSWELLLQSTRNVKKLFEIE